MQQPAIGVCLEAPSPPNGLGMPTHPAYDSRPGEGTNPQKERETKLQRKTLHVRNVSMGQKICLVPCLLCHIYYQFT